MMSRVLILYMFTKLSPSSTDCCWLIFFIFSSMSYYFRTLLPPYTILHHIYRVSWACCSEKSGGVYRKTPYKSIIVRFVRSSSVFQQNFQCNTCINHFSIHLANNSNSARLNTYYLLLITTKYLRKTFHSFVFISSYINKCYIILHNHISLTCFYLYKYFLSYSFLPFTIIFFPAEESQNAKKK